MQRICKYPLLFADLYKYTPVIDGPDSRVELEKALCGLKEMVKGINKATNDQDTRERIKRSRHLQDLLILPETVSPFLLTFETPVQFFNDKNFCSQKRRCLFDS